METIITCAQCGEVISETISCFRIRQALQALCEKCLRQIPQKWKIAPGGSVISTPHIITIHMALRDSAVKVGFRQAEPRFRTPTKIIRKFLPEVSLNGHEA